MGDAEELLVLCSQYEYAVAKVSGLFSLALRREFSVPSLIMAVISMDSCKHGKIYEAFGDLVAGGGEVDIEDVKYVVKDMEEATKGIEVMLREEGQKLLLGLIREFYCRLGTDASGFREAIEA